MSAGSALRTSNVIQLPHRARASLSKRNETSMNKRRYLACIGLIGALALGVGIIVLMTSSPSHRTVTVAPPAAARRTSNIDQVQAKTAFEEQVATYRKAGEPVR